MRGAYYIANGDKKVIDFHIVFPNGAMMHVKEGRNEGLFFFDADLPGEYKFVFSN